MKNILLVKLFKNIIQFITIFIILFISIPLYNVFVEIIKGSSKNTIFTALELSLQDIGNNYFIELLVLSLLISISIILIKKKSAKRT